LIAILIFHGIVAYQDWQANRPVDEETPAETVDEEADATKIGYVDLSGAFGGPGLYGATLEQFTSPEEARTALDANDIRAYYVIADDYMATGDVTLYAESFGLDTLNTDGMFQSFLMQTLLDGVDRDLALRLNSDLVITEHVIDNTGEAAVAQNEDTAFLTIYVFALLMAFSAFIGSGYLMQSVIEEKETRMVEVMLSTVRPGSLLTGKILAAGLLGLAPIAAWTAAAIYILNRLGTIWTWMAGFTVPGSLVVWLIVYFILTYLFFAGVYGAIGAISTSMREGPQMAVFITLPAMIPLYFISIFAESPNAALPVILSIFPITAPMAMIQRLAVTAVPAWQILVSLGVLVVSAVVAIWFAGRLFRVNTLLAGQTPKWQDILRIVRE
jgi:ABC-2 type transport system permease protein